MSLGSLIEQYETDLDDAKEQYSALESVSKCEHVCQDCMTRLAENESQRTILSVYINEKTKAIEELKNV